MHRDPSQCNSWHVINHTDRIFQPLGSVIPQDDAQSNQSQVGGMIRLLFQCIGDVIVNAENHNIRTPHFPTRDAANKRKEVLSFGGSRDTDRPYYLNRRATKKWSIGIRGGDSWVVNEPPCWVYCTVLPQAANPLTNTARGRSYKAVCFRYYIFPSQGDNAKYPVNNLEEDAAVLHPQLF